MVQLTLSRARPGLHPVYVAVSALLTNDDHAFAFPDTSDRPSLYLASHFAWDFSHPRYRANLPKDVDSLRSLPFGRLGAAHVWARKDAPDHRPHLCHRIIGRHSLSILFFVRKSWGSSIPFVVKFVPS
jgi:hypothetical protein